MVIHQATLQYFPLFRERQNWKAACWIMKVGCYHLVAKTFLPFNYTYVVVYYLMDIFVQSVLWGTLDPKSLFKSNLEWRKCCSHDLTSEVQISSLGPQ